MGICVSWSWWQLPLHSLVHRCSHHCHWASYHQKIWLPARHPCCQTINWVVSGLQRLVGAQFLLYLLLLVSCQTRYLLLGEGGFQQLSLAAMKLASYPSLLLSLRAWVRGYHEISDKSILASDKALQTPGMFSLLFTSPEAVIGATKWREKLVARLSSEWKDRCCCSWRSALCFEVVRVVTKFVHTACTCS